MSGNRRSRFGNVRQLASGRWQARYERPPGTWHKAPQTFTRKQAALDWLDDQNVDRRRGDWLNPEYGRTPFKVVVERWKAGVVGLRESTRVRDFGYLDRYVIPAFGDMAVGELDHECIRSWVAELSVRLSPATVAKALQILSKVLSFAVSAGLIPSNPATGVTKPKIEREEMRFLTVAQVDALAAQIDGRYRALVYVGAYGGLRMSELLGLKWERVKASEGILRVSENLVEVGGLLYTEACKTRASVRTVSLPRVARRELERVPVEGEYVWTAPKGGPVRLASWRSRYWYPATKAAGLEGVRPHDLRHTCAALMIAAGVQPLEVSRRLGHTSVSFTLDRYGHLYPGSEAELNEKLDRLASGTDLASSTSTSP